MRGILLTASGGRSIKDVGRELEIRLTVTATSLAALFIVVGGSAQQTPSAPTERDQKWREDVQFFATEFARHQKDFAKLYPRAAFNSAVTSLESDIPRISDTEIVLRLMRVVASANMGHNTVYLPRLGFGFVNRLPLTVQWYSDGLVVTGAAPAYASAIGTRILKFGTMSSEQLLSTVAPYISHENDGWLRHSSPDYLISAGILRVLGVLDENHAVSIAFAKPGGDPFTLKVVAEDPRVTQTSLNEALGVAKPMFLTRTGEDYWYRYLEDSRTLFIQYNNCRDNPAYPFADFTRNVLADADSQPIRRIVIDLRLNSGGNSNVIGPLVTEIKSRLKDREVYVLIGPGTFSSGLDNAVQLQRELKARLAGEPPGENLNSYGQVSTFTLPHSGLTVQYSIRYFQLSRDTRAAGLVPDLFVPRTFADALAGRDPVLDAVIHR